MSDNLIDLGTASLFTLDPNWVDRPNLGFLPWRQVVQFPGTVGIVNSLGSLASLTYNVGFLLDRSDYNYMLGFMTARGGNAYRFWFRQPTQAFTLKATAGIGALTIYVERNEFDWNWQGDERFYIEMVNGDIITRKITTLYENVGQDRLEITFGTPLDRTIAPSAVLRIGRLLLVRFESSDFTFKMQDQETTECSFKVLELLYEYSEII